MSLEWDPAISVEDAHKFVDDNNRSMRVRQVAIIIEHTGPLVVNDGTHQIVIGQGVLVVQRKEGEGWVRDRQPQWVSVPVPKPKKDERA